MIRLAAVLFSLCFSMFGQSGMTRPKPSPFAVRPMEVGPVASPVPPVIVARPRQVFHEEAVKPSSVKPMVANKAFEEAAPELPAMAPAPTPAAVLTAAAPVPAAMVTAVLKKPHVATASELKELSTGTDRDQVIARLGAPASRISMFEDGRLQESYRYSVGRVRLVDGHVTAVEVAQ